MKKAELTKLLATVEGDLALGRATLNRDMGRQPGLYYRYASVYVRALRESKAAKMVLEEYEGTLWRKLSKVESRVTERMLMTDARANKKWRMLRARYDEASLCSDTLEQVCRAFEHKRDMLVNLGATVRAETSSEVSTRK